MDSSDNPVAGWMLFLLFIVINSIFYGFGSAIQNLNENEIEDKAEQGDRKSKPRKDHTVYTGTFCGSDFTGHFRHSGTKKNLLSTCSSFRLSDGTYGAGRYYSGLADYKIDGTFNQSHRTPVWY